MTCNCKAELAAAIRADKAKYQHAEGVAILNRIADALSPPPSPHRKCGDTHMPARRLPGGGWICESCGETFGVPAPPAAPVPELAGWRAKCGPHTGHSACHDCDRGTPWILRYDPDGRFIYERSLWYCDGQWEPSNGAGVVKQFPTRAAAVAALNAASEPPGCEDDKPATDNVNTRPHSVVVKVEPVPTAAAVVADGKAGGGQPATGIAAQARANSLADRLMGENKNLRDWMRRAIAEEIQIVNDTAEQAGYERGKAEFVGTTTFDLLMKAGESLQRDVAKATQPAAPADAKEVEDARWRKEGPAL